MKFPAIYFFLFLYSYSGLCQTGFVLTRKDKKPIEFVNIGIIGKGVGTTTNKDGRYNLTIGDQYFNDSIRFSCIGYKSYTAKVSDFMNRNDSIITLDEDLYTLKEVIVNPIIYKQKTLGYTSHSKTMVVEFEKSDLGYEVGILLKIRKTAKLERLNLNLVKCSLDTIHLRINFYKVSGIMEFENILTTPIYLKISNKEIKDKVTIDLLPYDIKVKGDCLVTLECIKEMGDGDLSFSGNLNGKTYVRKTSQDSWQTIPFGVCYNVEAKVEK